MPSASLALPPGSTCARPAQAPGGRGEGPFTEEGPPLQDLRWGRRGTQCRVCPSLPSALRHPWPLAALQPWWPPTAGAPRCAGPHTPSAPLRGSPAFVKTVRRDTSKQFKQRKAFLLLQHSKDAEASKVRIQLCPRGTITYICFPQI